MNSTKNAFHAAISKQNLADVKKFVKLFKIDSNEEISVEGFYWTSLH